MALDGFGPIEGASCNVLAFQTDEWISNLKVYWDFDHGVTQLDIHTNLGYFLTTGKKEPNAWEYIYDD